MKYYISYILLFCITIFKIDAQSLINNGPSYKSPIQIDSSENFIIPKVIDKSNEKYYSKDLRNYGAFVTTDIIIYNSKSFTSKSLFSKQRSFIFPIIGGLELGISTIYPPFSSISNNFKNSLILNDKLLFIAITSDFNKDGIISEEDPLSIYLSDKNGDNIRQITLPNMNLTGLTLSKDFKTIFITCQNDNNNDKKFENEKESIYQINLEKDISKIELLKVLL